MSSAKTTKRSFKRIFAWAAIVVGVAAIGFVAYLKFFAPGTGNGLNPGDAQLIGPSEALPVPTDNEHPENEDGQIIVEMSSYSIEVEGNSLLSAVALAEGQNAWSGTPAYVFIGERKQTDNLDNPSLALGELINAARNAAFAWGDDFNRAQMLESCQCIPSQRYMLIISNEKYGPMASVFEKAANDPTVLDMEDLLGRMSSFALESNENNREA